MVFVLLLVDVNVNDDVVFVVADNDVDNVVSLDDVANADVDAVCDVDDDDDVVVLLFDDCDDKSKAFAVPVAVDGKPYCRCC